MTKVQYVAAVNGKLPGRTVCGLAARDELAQFFDTPTMPQVSDGTRRIFSELPRHVLCTRCRMFISRSAQ